MSRAVMQQALEALENPDGIDEYNRSISDIAIAALRAALAEPRPIQECYGDCPADPATCLNPCNFEGRPKPEQKPQTTHWEGCEAVHPECRKPEQKPVGWQWLDTANYRKKLPVNAIPEHWRPLYTTPTPQPDTDCHAQGICQRSGYSITPTPRKPLTAEEIVDIWAGVSMGYDDEINIIELARAIERHHGIGEQT